MTASHYWLTQWLDENEIHSGWEIDHVLNSKSGKEGLIDSAFRAAEELDAGEAGNPDSDLSRDSIIAGRKMDLSGVLSCPSYGCMRQQIDSSFKQVWHYFDQIVVEGIPPQLFVRDLSGAASEEDFFGLVRQARDQALLLLYLRKVGAERAIVFAPKSYGALTRGRWQQHARELGLTAIVNESLQKKTIKAIIESSKIEIVEEDPGVWRADIEGEYLENLRNAKGISVRKITGKKLKGPLTPQEATRLLISNAASEMIYDVSLAQRLALPLVEPVSFPWISQSYQDDSKCEGEDDAVIRLGLPVFDSLSTKDFLRLREDERPAFEAFRAELRKAIQDKIAQSPSNPPAAIAKSIQNEYLRPGLASIEQRVRSRRSALIKKTAVNLTIGTSASAIGAIAGMPLLVEGVAALASAIPLAPILHKFIDDGEPIKMDKFYFLWQAEKQARHH